ncbi:MAG: S8 family serine peptidase, partial [Thaumarchaeota archaeon]|nr:S8 family serine peptidase [Nitrososphaerota archaeon]
IPLTGTNNAWTAGYDGTGQTIAILDTGVDKTHPFLSGKVVSEACYSTPIHTGDLSFCPNSQSSQTGSGAAVPCPSSFSECFHGTFVAGIAAGNDPTILPGFAKGANIIAVQIFHESNNVGDCGSSTPCIVSSDSDIINGLEYVYSLRNTFHIAAVNLSLGSDPFTSYCDSSFPQYKSEFDTLQSVGIAPVVAAGNDGFVNALDSPACVSSAISVGSTTDSDQVSSFSDRASFLSLLAPGQSVISSVPGGGTSTGSGTSFATPAVAGAFAILKQKNPSASVSTILSDLRTTGITISDSGSGFSFPRIKMDSALSSLSCSPPSSGDWTISSSCTISSTVTAPQNVIIQSGAVLTIPNGLTLNIDFVHHHLLVRAGGGVLIKAGGTIN